jgi:hypothetical protein
VPRFNPRLYIIPSWIWIYRSLSRAPIYRAPSRRIWFFFVLLFYIVGPRSYNYRLPIKPCISRAFNAQFLFPSLYLDFRQLSTIIASLSLCIVLKPSQQVFSRTDYSLTPEGSLAPDSETRTGPQTSPSKKKRQFSSWEISIKTPGSMRCSAQTGCIRWTIGTSLRVWRLTYRLRCPNQVVRSWPIPFYHLELGR